MKDLKKIIIRIVSIIGCVIFGLITLFSGSAVISCLPSDVGAAIIGAIFTLIPLSLLSLSIFGIIMTRTKKSKKPYQKTVHPQQVPKPISASPQTEKVVQSVLQSNVIKPMLEKKQTAVQESPPCKSVNINQKRSLQIKVSDYVVLDIETTGLKPDRDEIIELSAIKIRNNTVVNEFSRLIKPNHPVSSLITDITGITNKMLKNAPRISEVLPLFLRFVGNDIIIGHNIVKFDRKFIENACSNLKLPAFNNDAIDTLCISRNLNLDTPNNKLTTLTEYFGINHKNAHRALSDCYATYELYEILKDFGLKEVRNSYNEISVINNSNHHSKLTDSTKALKRLTQLMTDMISDKVLTDKEIYYLNQWLNDNCHLLENFPFNSINNTVKTILEDGFISETERACLLEKLNKFSDPIKNISITKLNSITFESKLVCLTGEFKECSKEEFKDKLQSLGAVMRSDVSGKTDYLIVGSKGSDEWACGSYGAKIKKALELQEQGKKIIIIKESDIISQFKCETVIK